MNQPGSPAPDPNLSPSPTPAPGPGVSRIAVAGATGTAGRLVVAEALGRGLEVVALSRGGGIDLARSASAPIDDVTDALRGCDAVLDCLNIATMARAEAIAFFTATTRTLLAAGRAAGVPHHVTLSIVGIDRAPTPYYCGKRAQETLVEQHDGGVTILRATQFHQFPAELAGMVRRGPLLPVPRMRVAPVDAAEVATALLDLACGAPRARVEMDGPEVHELPDLVRRSGLSGVVVPVPYPGRGSRAVARGALLSRDPWRTGRRTFADWLADR